MKHPSRRDVAYSLRRVAIMTLAMCSGSFGQVVCNASAFGPQDPLIISSSLTVGQDCVLDFGARHVILSPIAVLSIGTATIMAGQFTMQGGSLITGPSGSLTIVTDLVGSGSSAVTIDGTINLAGGCQGAGGRISITSTDGQIVINGPLIVTGGTFGGGGTCLEADKGRVAIHAQGAVQIQGAIDATGAYPTMDDGVFLTSDTGSVSATSVIDVSGIGGNGGNVGIEAAHNISMSGSIIATGSADESVGGQVHISAGQTVTVSGAINCFAQVEGALVIIQGCRVNITTAGMISADGLDEAGAIEVTAGDLLEVHGNLSATPPGAGIALKTRLAGPYSPILNGAVFNPAPSVIHDHTLLPCLAALSTALTGPSPLVPGNTFVVNLMSTPSRPVLVVADLSLGYLPLSPLGWTQLNLFTALRLADFGLLGPPIPGSFTDASGHWGVSFPTPASATFLIGLTIYVEAFVFEIGAANGIFHQPPYLAIQFI